MRGCTNLNLQSLEVRARADAEFALYAGRSTTENKRRHRLLKKNVVRSMDSTSAITQLVKVYYERVCRFYGRVPPSARRYIPLNRPHSAVYPLPQPFLQCPFQFIHHNTFHSTLLNTGCPRRNVPNFGRVFLMLKYTEITQNTYVQS